MSLAIEVTVLVDWKAQMHNCRADRISDKTEQAEKTLQKCANVLAKALNKINSNARYKVSLRLYHGWSKGYEWTENKKAIIAAIAKTDFSALSIRPNVIINPEIGYGDLLITGLQKRISKSRNIHLPGTLRDRGDNGLAEKMVDTALASDLLSLAFNHPKDWSIVLAEDDDLVPPLFTAEALKDAHGGKVYLLRKRKVPRSKVILDDIIIEDAWND
ncbi:hypothetical protein NGA35_07040 [Pseudomonas stutzeri]|nr:hypothetical protein [Stutzerimonas stutzeri]